MAYFSCAVFEAGVPFSASFSLLAVRSPVVWTMCPSEFTFPEKSTLPSMPDEGSTNPDADRFRFLTDIWASRGVSAASSASGPAWPSSFKSASPGNFAERVNGNWDLLEKFFTVMSTSLTVCTLEELVLARETLPSLTARLLTERLSTLPEDGSVF